MLVGVLCWKRCWRKVSPIIEDLDNLIVPSITIYEVFKKLIIELDEDRGLFAIAHMKQGK